MKVLLGFINENGILFSGVFGLLAAIISPLVANVIQSHNDLKATIKALEKELEKAKVEIERYKSLECAEENIHKGTGSIYYESVPNGNRSICGFCWETKRVKIPITVRTDVDLDTREHYRVGYCSVCKSHCTENDEVDCFQYECDECFDGELPF